MIDQIHAKVAEWQQDLDQMTAQRTKLVSKLGDLDVAIQRTIGAIQGAAQLLKEAPAPGEQEQQTRSVTVGNDSDTSPQDLIA